MKKSNLIIIKSLATMFEEKVLDGACGNLDMKWIPFIKKVLEGWNPPELDHISWDIDRYREAVKLLRKNRMESLGSSMANWPEKPT